MVYGIGFSQYPETALQPAAASNLAAGRSDAMNPTAMSPTGVNPDDKSSITTDKTSPTQECQTCKNRKYRDGSNEMVSFKTAQSIAPEAAATRIRAHEQEHVSNAYTKAAQKNGKVIQASVHLQTAICPECGRSYVAGGVTNTRIQYRGEKENPYLKEVKEAQSDALSGQHIDAQG